MGGQSEAAILRGVRSVLLDMDGVLYVGNQALPGVQELLDYLDASGRKWLCVTNNSSRTSQDFSQKLAAMQVKVDPTHILGSAEATANWLAERVPAGTKVIMMGEASLRAALEAKDFDFVTDPFAAEVAVATIFFAVNYSILSDMTLAIRNGARFVATNSDPDAADRARPSARHGQSGGAACGGDRPTTGICGEAVSGHVRAGHAPGGHAGGRDADDR